MTLKQIVLTSLVTCKRIHTMGQLAAAMGMSPAALSRRINGQTEFRRDELIQLCDLLDIEREAVL